MGKKAILFDLDGTLLPMDQEVFTRGYFGLLCRKLAPLGYQPEQLVAGVWAGVKAVVLGDPDSTGEERFWREFAKLFGERVYRDKELIDSFYSNEFNRAIDTTQPTPLAHEVVEAARCKAEQVLLATNPIFPRQGTLSRIGWAGLKPEQFDLITTYEDCRFCKPDPRYYAELLDKQGLRPEDCLMIGNDVNEDIKAAQKLGIETWLVTDCLIGDPNEVSTPSGTLKECLEMLRAMPE